MCLPQLSVTPSVWTEEPAWSPTSVPVPVASMALSVKLVTLWLNTYHPFHCAAVLPQRGIIWNHVAISAIRGNLSGFKRFTGALILSFIWTPSLIAAAKKQIVKKYQHFNTNTSTQHVLVRFEKRLQRIYFVLLGLCDVFSPLIQTYLCTRGWSVCQYVFGKMGQVWFIYF